MGRFPGWASRVGELVVVALGHVVHLLVPGVVALRLTGALFPVAVEVDPEVLVVLLGAIVVVLVLLGVEVKRDGVFLAFEQAVLLLRI